MNKICALAILVAANLVQLSTARADDYDNGREAGSNGNYGRPDNTSSYDYVQGYQQGQQQLQYQQRQQQQENSGE